MKISRSRFANLLCCTCTLVFLASLPAFGKDGVSTKGGVRFTVEIIPEKGGKVSKDDVASAAKNLSKRFKKVKGTRIAPGGKNRILVEIMNPEGKKHPKGELEGWKRMITSRGDLKFYLGHPDDRGTANDPDAEQPPGSIMLPLRMPRWEEDDEIIPTQNYLLVREKAEITGEEVKYARAFSQLGKWGISLQFDRAGSESFFELSKLYNTKNGTAERGTPFAVALDGVVLSNPIFRTQIPSGYAQITGDFTESEARDLASAMMTPLTRPLKIVDTEIVEAEGSKAPSEKK